MDLIGSVVLLVSLIIVGYSITKKRANKTLAENGQTQKENIKILEEEVQRRRKILEKVEKFLKSSQFIEPIAKWRNENIYKYIFNDGYVYEFEEIMAENNQRVGMDEDFLCFKQMCYKRVNNPGEFFNTVKTQGLALNTH